jgi:hypothetical protein
VENNIIMPLKLYYNNKSIIFYSYNNKSSSIAKHVHIKYYVIKKIIHGQIIELEHINNIK